LILRAPPKNSSKKEKKIFLLGSARVRAGGGTQCGRGKAKLFLREEKDLLCLGSFFKTARILHPPRRRVREECAADFLAGGLNKIKN
jgi:hypothetical protein